MCAVDQDGGCVTQGQPDRIMGSALPDHLHPPNLRDPMSHRIIEKRRRDRMNNCLADLSRLIPTAYLKKGRGRIEKTEIIEMAIKHLKHLQAHSCKDPTDCDVAKAAEQDCRRQYRLGFQECMSETVRFLVEVEGLYAGDRMCVQLVNHLQKHYDKITGGMYYNHAQNVAAIVAVADDSSTMSVDGETSNQVDTYPSLPSSETAPTYHQEQTGESNNEKDVTKCLGNATLENNGPDHTQTARSPPLSGTVPSMKSTGSTTSQLREMLQNPGLPVERIRSTGMSGIPNGCNLMPVVHQTTSMDGTTSVATCTIGSGGTFVTCKVEEVYKYKNNIKDRFNADLQHHVGSPGSVLLELEDDGTAEDYGKCSHSHSQMEVKSVQQAAPLPGKDEPKHAVGGPVVLPRPVVASPHASELSVKIPEHTAPDPRQPWENHTDSGSSCGSNPSPPSVGRSNGSSSGYSTAGDSSYTPKVRSHHTGRRSPYLRTPENLSTRSPSPSHLSAVAGIPIFALHPKGTFYIPLTLDAAVLAPYMQGFEESLPILHPVSISVNFNFCRPFNTLDNASGTTWQPQSCSYALERYNQRCTYGDRSTLAFACNEITLT